MVSILLDGGHAYVVEGKARRGRVRVKRHVSFTVTDGWVVNGAVRMPEQMGDRLKQALAEAKIRSKNAVVTLDSTALLYREMVLPSASKKQLGQMVRNELRQSMGVSKDAVVDYVVVGPGDAGKQKSVRVLAVSVQKPLVQGYLDMLQRAGLKSVAMDIVWGAMEKLLSLFPEYQTQSAIITAQIAADVLVTGLYSGGRHVFTRMTRLSSLLTAFGPDPQRRTAEICDSISKMVQFQTARNASEPIQRVLLTGDVEDMDRLVEQIHQLVHRPAGALEAQGVILGDLPVPAYACAIGALIRR